MTLLRFRVTEGLKQRMVRDISYDPDAHVIIIRYKHKSIRVFTYPQYPEKTMEIFEEQAKGIMNQQTIELMKLNITDQWNKYIHNFKDLSRGREDKCNSEDKEKQTKSTLVLEACRQYCVKVFMDDYQIPHVAILVNGHLEVLSLNSKRFRNWIARILYTEYKTVLDSNTLKDTTGILCAEAIFDSGDPIKLNLRVAQRNESIDHLVNENPNNRNKKLVWYYDLTNKEWEFIEISSEGWNLVKNNKLILFRRFSSQSSQVYPSKEYSPDIFDKFIRLLLKSNIKDENNRNDYEVLLKCYIISLLVPDISKAVLTPHGHQGSAKSTMMESIKTLIDPSVITTLSFPRDKNELIQQLSHNYIAIYDNVSILPKWISDEICRAVTGSGSSKRVLYSDDEDFIYNLRRCVGINGINLAATGPDLLDRALIFELKRIGDKDNRKLEDIKKEVAQMIPELLGYILDILVKVLKFKESNPDFKLGRYPRMADFAEYAEIISRCMGYADNTFIEAYWRNISSQTDEVIYSSQIATCLMHMMFEKYGEKNNDFRQEWLGTASSLLLELQAVAEDLNIDAKNKYFPKNPNVLSRRLNEIVPALEDADLSIEFLKNQGPSRVRNIRICKISSPSSLEKQHRDMRYDEDGDSYPFPN